MEDIAAAFDDIAYLSGSPTRVEVLQYLRDESLIRSELEDRCGASRVTLGRVLTSLEDRGWVTKDDQAYRATSLGELVYSEFLSLCRTVGSVRKLHQVADWLPPSFDLDPLALADAELTLGTRANPFAPVLEFAADTGEAHTHRILTPLVTPEAVERSWDAVVNGGQQLTLVVTEDVLDVIRSTPQLDEQLTEMLAQEGVDARVTDEDVPYMLAIGDEQAHLGLIDDDGIPRALLTCSDPAAIDWCVAEFEAYWNDAEPIAATSPTDLTSS